MFEKASNSDGTLIDPGNYRLEVVSIEDAGEGQFGPSVLWKFSVADAATPENFKVGSDGEPYLLFQWSSTKMSPRARARAWAEALLGRALAEKESITPSDLIGQSMLTLVIHEEGADGAVRAKISKEMKPKAFGRTVAETAALKAPTNGSMTRDQLLVKAKSSIQKAVLLEAEGSENLDGLVLTALSDDQLRTLLKTLADAIRAAAVAV